MTIDALHVGLALLAILCGLGWAWQTGYMAGMADTENRSQPQSRKE
jgi:hypothetical protein